MEVAEPNLCDEWADPYSYIDQIFLDAMIKNSDDVNASLNDMNEADLLDRSLQISSFAKSIPYLTKSVVGKVQSGQLCRYRGLVQDMYGGELYSGAIRAYDSVKKKFAHHVSKYRDVLSSDCIEQSQLNSDGEFDSSNEYLRDRTSFLLVPVPGQTSWVKKGIFSDVTSTNDRLKAKQSASDARKRTAAESGIEELPHTIRETLCLEEGLGVISEGSTHQRRRTSDEEEEEGNHASTDHQRSKNPTDTSEIFSLLSKSFPGIYDEQEDICCLAKVYDSSEGMFRLNDLIEVVGIYTVDPILEASQGKGGNILSDYMDPFMGFEEEDESLSLPPPSIAPRIHCITFRRLGSSFPLLYPVHSRGCNVINTNTNTNTNTPSSSSSLYSSSLWETREPLRTECAQHVATKEWVVRRIAQALDGDSLAAEYVVLAVLSRLYSREDGSLLLGSLSLSLCGCVQGDARVSSLKAVLSEIVPLCVQITADIASLNAVEMMPCRDYSKNRLSLSPLQLGNGTVLIIDETRMGEGALTETGTRSLSALKGVASQQLLPVSYPYYELNVPTDLPVLCVTSSSSGNSIFGESNVLKVILQQRTVSSAPTFTEGSSCESLETDAEMLDRARAWWSSVRLTEVSMSEHMAMEGVNSFAAARQTDMRLMQNDFHRWLTVSRLIAVSEGAVEITARHWDTMRALEKRRLDRLPIAPLAT